MRPGGVHSARASAESLAAMPRVLPGKCVSGDPLTPGAVYMQRRFRSFPFPGQLEQLAMADCATPMRKRGDLMPAAAPDSIVPRAGDRLLAQPEAAAYLGVSVSYLRASNCPKRLLPGTGPKGKPLVRYRLSELDAWADSYRLDPR